KPLNWRGKPGSFPAAKTRSSWARWRRLMRKREIFQKPLPPPGAPCNWLSARTTASWLPHCKQNLNHTKPVPRSATPTSQSNQQPSPVLAAFVGGSHRDDAGFKDEPGTNQTLWLKIVAAFDEGIVAGSRTCRA